MEQTRITEIAVAILEDLGGAGEVSEVLARLVDDFSFAVVLRDLLAAHLSAVGPLTKRNQQRAASGAWERASVRAERLAARIGTERLARFEQEARAFVSRRPNLLRSAECRA